MIYSAYEMIWLFFIYSFLGWMLETIVAAVRQKRFVNRGLVNAPFCIIYGFAAVSVTVFCMELRGFWLFAVSMVITTLIEWVAGHWIERVYHERWWDYSKIKVNLDGYICLPASILWGVLSVIIVRWGNFGLIHLFDMMPEIAGIVIIWILSVVLAVDIAATLFILSGKTKRLEQWKNVDSWLSSISLGLGQWIYRRIDRRIQRAYPSTHHTQAAVQKNKTIFAYGCSFYKIIWLFGLGAFLGDITETIFCRLTAGVWMSRSSVVWGPFSIVWGLALAAATLLLYKYRERSDAFIFIAGTCLGGAYEYICSVFTEMVFGKVFWDYSKIPFNLGGRINLLYCFFWGIAAVIWIKGIYPIMSSWIEKVPMKIGKIVTWLFIVFFCCNIIVSCMALVRSDQRAHGIPAEYTWQQIMDERFDDNRLKAIYPNAIQTE